MHVRRERKLAKFWLEPVELADSKRFAAHELREIEERGADLGHACVGAAGVDGLGAVALETEDDRLVGAVPVAGGAEGAVELRADGGAPTWTTKPRSGLS